MPRPPIDRFWKDEVKTLYANNKRISHKKILMMLEAKGKLKGRSDWPAERSIGTIIKEYLDSPEEEQRAYRQVRWPESFDTPELPWEAAPIVLEALRFTSEENRPTVRTAKWFWRISLASPAMPVGDRLKYARIMAASESIDQDKAEETRRGIEWRLIHPDTTPPKPLQVWASFDAVEEEGITILGLAKPVRDTRSRQEKEEGEK